MKKNLKEQTKNNSRFILLLISAFLTALCCHATQSQTDGQGEGGQGVLPEVLIEAEHNKPLTLEKPPLNFQVEENQPIGILLKKTDRSLMNRLPSEIIQSNAFEPEIYISSKVIVPLHLWIARPWLGEPVHIFHLQEILSSVNAFKNNRSERKKSEWSLDVVDSEGKPFRHFSSKGLVPKKLSFDGKSEAGKWLAAGEIYVGVLKVTDSKGRIHTAYGHSFKLAGVSLKENDGFIINLDAGVLFSTESARPRFSPFGRELMSEATQLLERYYPGFNIEVNLKEDRFSPEWLKEAASLCATDIARRLIKKPSDIKTRWTIKISGVEPTLQLFVRSK